jgi:hypothetical protein
MGNNSKPKPAPKREDEIALLIDGFANGTGDVGIGITSISTHFENDSINWAQKECFKVEQDFPRTDRVGWCNEKGLDRLRAIASELRASGKG